MYSPYLSDSVVFVRLKDSFTVDNLSEYFSKLKSFKVSGIINRYAIEFPAKDENKIMNLLKNDNHVDKIYSGVIKGYNKKYRNKQE